jgi:hypothetical protein
MESKNILPKKSNRAGRDGHDVIRMQFGALVSRLLPSVERHTIRPVNSKANLFSLRPTANKR